MAALQPPEPVKLVAALLGRDEDSLRAALAALSERFGPIDHEGRAVPFDRTRYYEPEMGSSLERRVISFRGVRPTEALVEAKAAAVAIEDALRGPSSGRRINVDPGYMDYHKLVLASLKAGPMKVHLGGGIYADIIARWFDGAWRPTDWTFEDFRAGLYDADLSAIRMRYRAEMAPARDKDRP